MVLKVALIWVVPNRPIFPGNVDRAVLAVEAFLSVISPGSIHAIRRLVDSIMLIPLMRGNANKATLNVIRDGSFGSSLRPVLN